MKIQGIYQFYLSYVLPRLGEGVSADPLKVEADKFTAFVSPRRLDEPLFPDDIDVTLSSMELSIRRHDGVEGGLEIAAAASCLDRIRVVLEWETSLEARTVYDELDLSLQRAVEVADYYLDHYRHVARSSYVARIQRFWRPEDQKFYISVPHTVSWFDLTSDGKRLTVFENESNALSDSGAIRSPESGVASLEALNISLTTSVDPPLHRTLLVDADGYIHALGLREATLSLASACEIAAQLLIKRVGASRDRVKMILDLKGISFAERYYKHLPEAIGSEGFDLHHLASFSSIEEMYRQRNSLIHTGAFKAEFAAMRRIERQATVHIWMLAAREAVEWMDSVSPSI